MLPGSPPIYPSWTVMLSAIKLADGIAWRVYALQKALQFEDEACDGAFGPVTDDKLRRFQAARGLVADGRAGRLTQEALLKRAEHDIHAELPGLPEGVLRGFTIAEGAGILAATNPRTPPGAPPGVDCGPVQWRQLGPPFAFRDLKRAFNPRAAYRFAGMKLLERITDYGARRPSLSSAMRLRLALLAHNAPFLSDQVVRNGELTTPDALALWTDKPGGGHYTHAEWLQEYPDRILAHVTG